MAIATHIFKAYDIRGLADTELSDELAYKIGRAFVAYVRASGIALNGKKIVVGRDMRPTSPGFSAKVIEGLCDEGVEAVDIGQTTTPLFNFTCTSYPGFAAGIMITASHNPAEYNGFKMTLASAVPVPGKALYEWVRQVEDSPRLGLPTGQAGGVGVGSVSQFDPLFDYLKKIFSFVPVDSIKPLKVVVDCGNGMGIVTFRKLLEMVPQVQATFLYSEPDGTFPNHEANPLKVDTLTDLQKKVVEIGADFGFALDGDCDRIGLVDEKGQVVEASFVGALIGSEVLASHPGARMLYDLRSSMIVPETWQSLGGQPAMCMVGHANIKKQMQAEHAAFASELSLHLYYGDLHGIESSDLCLLYTLKILSEKKQPLSQLIAPYKKYTHSGEINFEVEDTGTVMHALESEYASDAAEVSHLDGLWMRLYWGWVSIRASNTEPVLRLNLEASDSATCQAKVAEISQKITHSA